MNFPARFFFFIMFTGLLFAACNGEATQPKATAVTQNVTIEPTATETAVPPTETPAPTNTPTVAPTSTLVPTATPTHTPEPTPDPYPGYSFYENDGLNLALRYPETWILSQPEEGGVVFIGENDEALQNGYAYGALILIIPDELTIPAETYVDLVMESIISNESLVTNAEPDGEVEIVIINNYEAAQITYTAVSSESGEDVRLFFTAVGNGDKLRSFFTILPLNTLKQTQPVYENIVNSVNLGEPTNAASEIDKSMFVVSEYDPERDPTEDVENALSMATEEGKRVLLIIGGDWCITCHILDGFIEQSAAVASGLKQDFFIVKINYSEENENETFLSQYPDIEWFPHFYILNSDGTLAESYDTRGLETEGLYDEDKFLAFLDEWIPETASAKSDETAVSDDYYFVADYDPARDPEADVQAAVELAQASNKHILLIAGGEWCGWCHILEAYFHDTPSVEALLRENYLIVKVNFSEENENDVFFAQYPEITGYPHFFILESNGSFIRSQPTGVLESGDSYDEQSMVDFLTTWAPES
ncbi:MAG: DUF255 domain-containing protein [Chloroflexi bacterium]|nr:DUF255 domain-containing protein [Chloroflexota bacterium]